MSYTVVLYCCNVFTFVTNLIIIIILTVTSSASACKVKKYFFVIQVGRRIDGLANNLCCADAAWIW